MMMKVKKLSQFLALASSVLERLDAWLPAKLAAPEFDAAAYKWQRIGQRGVLHPLPRPHVVAADLLVNIDTQRQKILANTEQFIAGRPANNVLLTGARGTGKSSLVKSLLAEYEPQGLRLIEVDKEDLLTLPYLLQLLQHRQEKFILFCDDLSFESGDSSYKGLKTVLDGGLSLQLSNVLVYATSNRRHLLPDLMQDNFAQVGRYGEVQPQEAVDERVALSDRFGLWLSFYPFDQPSYLNAVKSWLEAAHIEFDEQARLAALDWAALRGSISGRVAWQFVCDYRGKLGL